MQAGKQIRLGHLLDPKSHRTVIIAIDHGLGGVPTGLEAIRPRLERILEGEPDGLILSAGLARSMTSLLSGRGKPALIITVDRPLRGTLPGKTATVEEYRLIVPVEDAVRLGADAVKMVMIYGREDLGIHAANVEAVAQVASECERWGIPLLLEPVLWGPLATEEDRQSLAILQHICRMGWEMGADMLKIPYIAQGFQEVVEMSPIPIVILGGAKTETEEEMFAMVRGAMAAGASGIAFGRNVFQREDPAWVIQKLREIVHGRTSAISTPST